MSPARLEARMDSLFSFPVGFFTPYNMPVIPAHSVWPTFQAVGQRFENVAAWGRRNTARPFELDETLKVYWL